MLALPCCCCRGSRGRFPSAHPLCASTTTARIHRERRRARVAELLAAEGLGEHAGTYAALRYVDRQEGSEEAVLEAARQERAANEARAARGARITQLLQAEGLPAQLARTAFTVRRYIESGLGSEEEALATAKRAQRSAELQAALEAEGLPGYGIGTVACASYLAGSGSLEEALASVRQRHQEQLQRQQRCEEVRAALSADGLPARYEWGVPAVSQYIKDGSGSLQAALDAARDVQQRNQQRAERRSAAEAVLAAEGLAAGYCDSVAALSDFIRTGEGETAAWLAAARERHQLEQQQAQRREALVAALQVHGLSTDLMHSLPSASAYIQRGEGSEAAVLEAAASYRPPAGYGVYGYGAYAYGAGGMYYDSDGE